MNLLAVADNVDPRVYSGRIKERFKDINCIIGAGDLDVSYYEYIVSCLNKPLYFVFGNHNLSTLSLFCPTMENAQMHFQHDAMKRAFGSVCVEGTVKRDSRLNIIIAGLGGSRRYNRGSHQFTEFQMVLRILKLIPHLVCHRIIHGRWLDILVTHAPPAGIHDREDCCHRGFKCFLWFMKHFKPRYLIHGHVHLYDINALRSTQYKSTTVLNAYEHIVIDWEKGMKVNSIIENQAEHDFNKAKHRAWLIAMRNIVNPQASQLLSFNDIKEILKPGGEKYLGMQAIPIRSIVGSEDRYHDFSRHFFPKREHLRHRWTSIDRAHLSNVILPPIKLLKLGSLYFVRDGNHRVSVARTQGVAAIDAEVIELTSEIPIAPNATRENIQKAVISWERMQTLAQTGLAEIIPVESIEFTTPGRWHEVLNHIAGHKYFMGIEKNYEIAFEDAAKSWYDNLYLPIQEIVRKEKILERFPDRTEADLYIWIIKHWHSLKEQYGVNYPLDKAVSAYAESHGKISLRQKLEHFWQRLRRQ